LDINGKSAEGGFTGMSARSVIWQLGVLLPIPFMLATRSAAETPKLSVEEANDACASYVGALVAHREQEDPAVVADWKFKCEHHPIKSTCEFNYKTIQRYGLHVTLKCGQPAIVIQSPPPSPKKPVEKPRGSPIDSKKAEGDDACSNYVGALAAHAEQDDPAAVADWKVKCEHHPSKSTCEGAHRFMERNMPWLDSLNCVGGDR
jgi:hypothetical protein